MPQTSHNPDRPRLSASSSGAHELGRVLLKPEDAIDRNLLMRKSRGKCNPVLISFTPLPNLHHLRQRIFLLLISPVSLVCRYRLQDERKRGDRRGGGRPERASLSSTPPQGNAIPCFIREEAPTDFPIGPSLRAKCQGLSRMTLSLLASLFSPLPPILRRESGKRGQGDPVPTVSSPPSSRAVATTIPAFSSRSNASRFVQNRPGKVVRDASPSPR